MLEIPSFSDPKIINIGSFKLTSYMFFFACSESEQIFKPLFFANKIVLLKFSVRHIGILVNAPDDVLIEISLISAVFFFGMIIP